MKSKFSKLLAILPLAFMASPPPASAANAVVDLDLAFITAGFQDGRTVGWAFTTNAPLLVTGLGWWVYPFPANAQPFLGDEHQVGIWTQGGTQLGSAVVTPGAPNDGDWRFVDTDPIALAAGTTYIIGGYDIESDADYYTLMLNSVTLAPELTLAGGAMSSGNDFSFPEVISPDEKGRYGPNFRFSVTRPPAVPEPASWALLIAGFGVVGAAARQRRSLSYGACHA